MTIAPVSSCEGFIAILQFGAPMLAWGALACSVPILVHLLLRPRPRRQVLPTLRFLMTAHRSANRRHRLKRLLLLACRMLAIAVLVLLLARPAYTPGAAKTASGVVRPAGAPVSAVIAFDNSASMAYRYQGRTRLDGAIEAARRLLDERGRFPAGSQVAVISGPPESIPSTWMEPATARSTLARVVQGDHDLGGPRLLERAYPRLAQGRHPLREIYLFSDMTQHGWAGSIPTPPPELSGVYVVDVGQTDSPNVALSVPRTPARTVTASRPFELNVAIASNGMSWDGEVSAIVDGDTRGSTKAPALEPQSQRDMTLKLQGLNRGAHLLALRLEPGDALPCDNERYLAIAAGERPVVLIVTDDPASQVPRLVRAMIAPPVQPESQHNFSVRMISRTDGSNDVTGKDSSSRAAWSGLGPDDPGASVIVLADVSAVSDPQWSFLEQFARRGGTVLIVPGSRVTPTSTQSAVAVLPAPILGVDSLEPPVVLAASDLSHPYLQPFVGEDVDSINSRRAFRRLRLGTLLPGSRILAPFADGAAGILERTIGSGRVILLAFSPEQAWGQFGTQAGPFLVLLQTILAEVSPRPQGVGSYVVGQSVSRAIPEPRPSEVFLLSRGKAVRVPVRLDRIMVPTGQPGPFALSRDVDAREILLAYSVNVAESESDQSRTPDVDLLARLPGGRSRIVRDIAELEIQGLSGGRAYQLTVPIGLLGLGWLLIESLFANRFYGRPTPSSPESVNASLLS